MFTISQITDAHRRVKSGADFPTYIQDLKKLGVCYYETFVADGHSDYYAENKQKVTSASKYGILEIAEISNKEQFKADLKAHQEGKTDYSTFCQDVAKSGVEKWVVYINEMVCSYFDKSGNTMWVEEIPH